MSFISFHNQYHAKSAAFPPKSSMITNIDFIQQFNKQEVNIKGTCVLDTVLPVFALFRQQKSFQTQPQHCFASLSNMLCFLLNESINRLNASVQSQ